MVRRGTPLRQVAEDFKVAPSTVLFWAQRAGTARLDRVEWTDRPRGPRIPANRYPRAVEDVVLSVRGGNLRISPHAYNDETDLDRLIDVLSGSA